MVQRKPSLRGLIEGDNLPAPPLSQLLATSAWYLLLAGGAFVLFGESIFSVLSMQQPAWFGWAKEHRLLLAGALFLVYMYTQSLLATGAFEIYVRGELTYSKLVTGRMPSLTEVLELLEARGL